MKVLRYAVHRQRPTDFLGAFLGTSRVETDTGVAHNALIDLAPRPGLEPGTCGLTVRRSVGKYFLIRLLQHTPSFKSSRTQPRMNCRKAKRVTKCIVGLSC